MKPTPAGSALCAIALVLALVTDLVATDIRIIKTALSAEVMVGQLVKFEIIADNTSQTGGGPLPAQSVTFTDQLPPELEYVSADGAECTVDTNTNTVSCTVGGMAAGTKKTVTITVKALAAGTVVNNAQIKTELFDPDPGNNHDSATITIVPASGDRAISGGVLEDVNYAGGPGRRQGVPRPGAAVELYDGSGAFRSMTTTDNSGSYAFTDLPSGDYTVRVVNETVTSSRPGTGTSGKRTGRAGDLQAGDLIPVQTWRTDASSGSVTPVPTKVGGEEPIKVDFGINSGGLALGALTTATTTAESVTAVTLGQTDVINVDFVYNFDTIVNTNASRQGSLDQFIINANALANSGLAQEGLPSGTETSIFMIPPAGDPLSRPADPRFDGSVFVIQETDGTPAVTDPVSINGHTERVLGDYRADGPDIVLDGAASELTGGLVFAVDGCHMTGMTIRNFAGHGFTSVGTINLGTAGETVRTIELFKNKMDGAHVEHLVYVGEAFIHVAENDGDGIEGTGNLMFDAAFVEKNGGWGIITSTGSIAFKVDDFAASLVSSNGLGGISAVNGSLTGSRIGANDNGAAVSGDAGGQGVIAKTIDVRGLAASGNKGDGIHADEVRITLDPSGGANASRNGGYGIYAESSIFLGRVQARKNGKWGIYSESGSVSGPIGPGGNFVDDNPLGGISARQGTVSGQVYFADDNGSGASGGLEGHGIIAKKIDVFSSTADDNAGHGFIAETINHREFFPSDALIARRNGKDGMHATGDITADRIITKDNGGWGAFSETGTYRTRNRRWHDFHSGNGLGGVGAPNGFVSAVAAYIAENGASSTSEADGYGVLAKFAALQRAGVLNSFRDGVVGETVSFKNSIVENSGGYGIVVRGGGLTVTGSTIRNNRKGGILRGPASSGLARTKTRLATTSKSPAESSLIEYSDISSNEGIGLAVETDDPVEIANSNLFGNTGLSLDNMGASSIVAVNNWWGDPAGPGTSVGGPVTTDPWLADDIGVVAFPDEDEHIASAGLPDSMFIGISNFADRTGEVDISKDDSLGWLVTDEVITMQLSDTLTVTYLAEYFIPAGLEDGSENEIRIRVVSKSDPTNEMTATYRVVVGTPVGIERDEPADALELPGVTGGPGGSSDSPAIMEVYPNPVRGTATVRVTLSDVGSQTVTLRLHDALGRNVGTIKRRLPAGSHVIALPLDGLPAGVYFVRMDSMKNVEVAKVIISR